MNAEEHHSYLEHVLSDHLVFLQSLYDIWRESEDAEAVRLASGALMATKTGQDYVAKMRDRAHGEGNEPSSGSV